MSSGDVVQAAPGGIGTFESPMAVTENARVGPRSNDLTDEQIVGLLVMRLRDDPAGEPTGATLHEWQVVLVNLEQLDSGSAQLVGFVAGAIYLFTQISQGTRLQASSW